MALQITDLVSQSALKQLSDLDEKLKTLQATYSKIGKDLAIHLTVDIKGKEDLDKFTKLIETDFKALNKAVKQSEESQKKFTAELGQEVKTIKEAQKYNRELRKARNDVNVTTDDGKKKLKEYNDQINKNTKLIKENTDSYTKTKMGIGQYFKNFTLAGIATTAVQGLANAMKQLASKAVDAFVTAIRHAADTIIQFEEHLSKLEAITGANVVQMAKMTAQALYLGQTTRYTASEIVELQTELAKLGFKTDEILSMTKAVEEFGLATGGSMADAASLAGAMLRTFGGRADETTKYLASMTKATTNSALSFGYLQTAMPIVSGAMSTMGFTIEDTLGLLGKLADSGLSASLAATALRNIFLHLSDSTSTLHKQFGNVKNLDEFVARLSELHKQGANLGDMLELTDKRAVVAFSNLAKHADDVKALRDEISDCDESLHEIADTMNDNVQGSIYALKSAWESVELAFYSSKGTMKEVLDYVVNIVRNTATFIGNLETIKGFAGASAADRVNKEMNEGKNGDPSKTQQNWDLAKEKYLKYRKSGIDADKAKEMAIKDVSKAMEQENKVFAKNANDMMRASNIAAESAENATSLKNGVVAVADAFATRSFVPIVEWGKNIFGAKKNFEAVSEEMQFQKGMLDQNNKTLKEMSNFDFEGEFNPNRTFKTPLSDMELRKLEEQQRKMRDESMKLEEIIAKARAEALEKSLTREIEIIKANYKKRNDEVEKLETTSAARRAEAHKQLQAAEQREIQNVKEKYEQKALEDDTARMLQGEKKKSEEAMNMELAVLGAKYNADYMAAKQYNEDLTLLEEAYEQKRREIREKYAGYRLEDTKRLYQRLQAQLTESMNKAIDSETKRYIAGEISQREYNESIERLNYQQAMDTLSNTAHMYEDMLSQTNLNAEKREEIETKLAETLNKIQATNTKFNLDNYETEKERRKKTFDDIVRYAMQAFAEISKFASQLYQNEIDELDDKKDAEEEKYDKDVERIERLEEIGAISSEDAEARKRAAKDRTEAKNKEISRQQNELAYKQAIWEKSASAAQTAINTAVAIMKAWATDTKSAPVMTALIAAAGAMQLATILATPVPKYAKGTEGHDGGPAIVGDGGRREFAMFGSQGWITPATPTLVDLPKGTIVYPDASKVATFLPVRDENGKQVQIVNDYRRLEKGQKRSNNLMVSLIREVHNGNSNYANYKRSIW